ncbi:hypothetical protein FRC03_002675 [Tulasnella sp. 419]|nr:hypothetical protein FRC03_002675 [Tulasnella sp. 419]
MNPRTKLAFFNDDEDESINIQVKPLDDQKAKTFSQGIHRKSKREKEKEAEAAKREEEEREAAKAYAEFLDEFEGPSANKTNAFVRASDSSGTTSTYTPSMSKDIPTGPRSRQLTGRSVSALAAYESQVGSRDRGDPLTTNVFVSNLPTTITEHSMGMFFAKMGPVGSVKIMWPRGDHNGGPGGDITSRRKTSGMSGFVSYMARSSAEACVREMDGYTWNGSVLRVGWSRAVPIAAKPMYGE